MFSEVYPIAIVSDNYICENTFKNRFLLCLLRISLSAINIFSFPQVLFNFIPVAEIRKMTICDDSTDTDVCGFLWVCIFIRFYVWMYDTYVYR